MIDDFYDPYTQMREYDELVAKERLMRVLLYPNRQKAHAQNLQRSGPAELQEYLDEGIEIVYAAFLTKQPVNWPRTDGPCWTPPTIRWKPPQPGWRGWRTGLRVNCDEKGKGCVP